MKIKAIFKNSKKAITVIAGLSLLLAFSQCKKDKEDDENFELACDASEYINNNLQSQLDMLNDKTNPEVMAALAEWMKGQEGVASAEAFSDRVEYVYVDGTKGVVRLYDQTIKSEFDFDGRSVAPSIGQQKGNPVGNQKGFIYDAFSRLDSEINPGDTVQKLFEQYGFEYAHPRDEECTIDTLKTMFQYGYVQFITHGDSDVIATGEKATRRKRRLYQESMENDLIRERRLLIRTGLFDLEFKGNFFGVTSKYFERFQNRFDNTIVFNSACKGFVENSPLKNVFLLLGASTYYGFDEDVQSEQVCDVAKSLVSDLFQGCSTGTAYDNICNSDEIYRCIAYDKIDETTGTLVVDHTTCLEIAGSHNMVWYEDPNAPSVTTHEVQPGSIATTTATVSGSVVFPNPSQPIEYERGFVYGTSSEGLVVGEADQVVYPGSDLLNFSCTLTGLLPNTTYFVKAYSRWENNRVIYGNMVSFTTLDGSDPDPGNHEYVDLGLPSGLLWATCNVGANSPEEYGDYFAWGETQPKDEYLWCNYQYANGYSWQDPQLTKYCSDSSCGYNGFTDSLTTLLSEDDAATANWGNGWRMPTKEEWQELLDNTTNTRATQNGVNGRLFTAPNGNSLFLPAAGCRYGSGFNYAGYGFYWSRSLNVGCPDVAWILYFLDYNSDIGGDTRDGGRSVRPVRSTCQK